MPSAVRSAGVRSSADCPCGSGLAYGSCCEPVLDGGVAATAEALVRSRFTAFVVGDEDHLFRTWHPRTRPEGPYCHPGTQWTSLTVGEVVGGGPGDDTGVVELAACYRTGDGHGGVVADTLRERSRLVRRGSRWVYYDGEVR
ncbi:YchJ family protein [Actinomyces wuliandei]|uniref:YchJ family protein n=1 Tax=Actinomyces wuliandei TaxID=2057743 RepID=UPI000FDAF332|nr:YchJ family metal-binding protein [Actinomyces wuliandei]